MIEFLHSTFFIRQSTFLEFTAFEFLAKKAHLFFNRAVLFQTAINAVDGMQCRGMVAIERFSNRLQRGIRKASCQIDGHLPGPEEVLFAGFGSYFI